MTRDVERERGRERIAVKWTEMEKIEDTPEIGHGDVRQRKKGGGGGGGGGRVKK